MIETEFGNYEIGLLSGLPANLTGFPWGRYLLEPKLDGVRALVIKVDGEMHAFTRAGQDITAKLLVQLLELSRVLPDDTVLDTEVVGQTDGKVDFLKANGTLNMLAQGARDRQAHEGYLQFMIFDCLRAMGVDIIGEDLETRRQIIDTMLGVDWAEPLLHSKLVIQMDASPANHQLCVDMVREGSVLKLRGSKYPRGRSGSWLRWKVSHEEDVVLMGVAEGGGKYEGTTGAVIFGQWLDGVLTVRGQASGMTDAVRDEMWKNGVEGKVAVIRHNGSLRGGWRHPQFLHFRTDKPAADCVWTEDN